MGGGGGGNGSGDRKICKEGEIFGPGNTTDKQPGGPNCEDSTQPETPVARTVQLYNVRKEPATELEQQALPFCLIDDAFSSTVCLPL